jgi:hypothetical protein
LEIEGVGIEDERFEATIRCTEGNITLYAPWLADDTAAPEIGTIGNTDEWKCLPIEWVTWIDNTHGLFG